MKSRSLIIIGVGVGALLFGLFSMDQIAKNKALPSAPIVSQLGAKEVALPVISSSSVPKKKSDDFTIDGLTHRITTEKVDQQWKQEAEKQLSEIFKKTAFSGAKIINMSCRSTICEVEITHQDTEKVMLYRKILPAEIPWSHRGISKIVGEGSAKKLVFFVSREVGQLPDDWQDISFEVKPSSTHP